MEDLGWRFPLISKIILNNVDNISLANFRKASRENSNFLENERFYWIRIIKKYSANFEEFKESWKKVISKTQVDFLKNLAIDVQTFFNSFSKRYNQQWHPLFIGAERGSLPLCEHVVNRTGDVNSCERIDGFTPLGFAAQEGHLEICVFLIKPLEDKNPGDKNGWTPLHRAAQNGHLEVCKAIVMHLGNKNPASNDGITPLHLAAAHGHLEISKILIKNLDDKNPGCHNGQTPL